MAAERVDESRLCEHGRLETAYCEFCEVQKYHDPQSVQMAEDTYLENDHVGHPMRTAPGWSSDYYELPEGAKELQDLIEHRNMNFAIGNIFKAAYRLGNKPGTARAYDLNKIIWYAQRELARLG